MCVCGGGGGGECLYGCGFVGCIRSFIRFVFGFGASVCVICYLVVLCYDVCCRLWSMRWWCISCFVLCRSDLCLG